MIATITPNIAIDKVLIAKSLNIGAQNKLEVATSLAGGKGINTARALRSLGKFSITVAGFIGGCNGYCAKKKMLMEGFSPVLVETQGETRICNIIVEDEGTVTEIYENGVFVTEEARARFLRLVSRKLRDASMIAMCGSLPQGLDSSFYAEVASILPNKSALFFDFSGEALVKALKLSRCFMLKINEKEFMNTFGVSGINSNLLLKIAKEFKIPLIGITLGEKGALLFHKGRLIRAWSDEKVQKVNPVGAGDAFLGGFIYAVSKGMGVEESFKIALACSKSNVTLYEGGRVNTLNYHKILQNTRIEEV